MNKSFFELAERTTTPESRQRAELQARQMIADIRSRSPYPRPRWSKPMRVKGKRKGRKQPYRVEYFDSTPSRWDQSREAGVSEFRRNYLRALDCRDAGERLSFWAYMKMARDARRESMPTLYRLRLTALWYAGRKPLR